MRSIGIILAVLLAGCTVQPTQLVNGQGLRVQCAAAGNGNTAVPSAEAMAAHDACVDRWQNDGYRVEAYSTEADERARARDNARRGRRAVSTGVQQIGPDTWLIARSRDRGGLVAAEAAALTEANGHCRERNTELLALSREPGRGNSFTLTFRCLRTGDPDLRRPKVEATPSRIIEQRQR